MDRGIFLTLETEKQVEYINEKLRDRQSLSSVCKEIGISKSIAGKFKNKGFELKDISGAKQYVISSSESQLRSSESEVAATVVEVSKPQRGRPCKINLTKHNVTLNEENWRQISVYALLNKRPVSEILDELLDKYIKENKIDYKL